MVRLPAEWERQSGVQLTWPHKDTDWADVLEDAIEVFSDIAAEVSKREKVMIVAHDIQEVRLQLRNDTNLKNVVFAEIPSNDTWARDHAPLTVVDGETPVMMDFCFNGWGMKFAADKDNCMTRRLYNEYRHLFTPELKYGKCLDFVLEGGSVESDGRGTLMVTSECLLSQNRNEFLEQDEIEEILKQRLGAECVLWVNNGGIDGDDTDGHIDTLARFCSPDTIAYVGQPGEEDEDYYDMKMMEDELTAFRTKEGEPYNLVKLPYVKFEVDGEPLPATYANFLIMNGAVLCPVYDLPEDDEALAAIASAFPGREIVAIDCRTLIKQHGSLHCVTMQYPENVVL